MHVDLSDDNSNKLNKLCVSGFSTPTKLVNFIVSTVLSELNEKQIKEMVLRPVKKGEDLWK